MFGKKMEKDRKKEKKLSVQNSISYKEMGADGICRVHSHFYSKTIRFLDITYKLASQDVQDTILDRWCDFLNYMDHTIQFQLSYINCHSGMEDYKNAIQIELQGDTSDYLREEYANFLDKQLMQGNDGLIREKYLTYGIEAENAEVARTRLEKIGYSILENFKKMGVAAYPLNGTERLRIMFNTFHSRSNFKFDFKFSWLMNGARTKDYIAPSGFRFSGRHFVMGPLYGAVSYLQIMTDELTDTLLSDLLDMEQDLQIHFHIQAMEQVQAVKIVKSKLADVEKMMINEQKMAVRSGYDMEIMPGELKTFKKSFESLIEQLKTRNQRLFNVTILIMNIADNRAELEDEIREISGRLATHHCLLERLDFQQEKGLMSSLPLAYNQVPVKRTLTTTATAIFVPFSSQELFMFTDSALYYGLNALTHNMIMADRKKQSVGNGLILGAPGSGKSFASKREITNVIMKTMDDVIICDPESEYGQLVQALNGQVVRVDSSSKQHINPLDINLNYSEGDDPLKQKSEFVLSLFELMMEGKNRGIEPEERTIIDRCLPIIYQRYFNNPLPENMPTLGDLYDCLLEQGEAEAKNVATILELYVHGSLNVFNHRTNVDINNRLVNFDIKDLGNQLKKLGMLIIQDQVWNRATLNRSTQKYTWFYCDEFHLLLREKQTAAFSVEIWKRFRKWSAIPTGITQNTKDFLNSPEIENIFENTNFLLLFSQSKGDREQLAAYKNISQDQLRYITNSNEGEGLLVYDKTIIPFRDRMDKTMELYRLLSTKPAEFKQLSKS